MKKIISITLSIAILALNAMPVLAVKNKEIKNKRVIQSQVSEYKFKDVNLEWWQGYNDEYLQGYIIKAIKNNYDLKIATLKVEEARQSVKAQFSRELPTASVGFAPALYKMNGVSNTEVSYGFPLMVNYEADIFLKNRDKTKAIKKYYEASQFNEKTAYISVASAVGAAYFNLVKMDKLIELQQQIISDRKEIYDLMKIRNVQGITSTADLMRAEKAYVLAQTDLSDLQKAREIVLNHLAVLIGDSPDNTKEFKRISYDEMNYKLNIPNEISSEVITQRPDYQAAEKMVEKAGIDVRVAKKEFLPKIDIIGLLFFNTSSLGASFDWKNALAIMGGQALLPLFTGGARIANLKIYKNRYEQILQNYQKTNLVAIQEVNDALSSLKLDNDKYNNNLKAYQMQEKDYGYMQKRYEQGVISGLDLIQQKETLLVLNKMVVSSKTDCYINEISLYKAVGGKL
ncbi:MAG TPA: TolC family protein [Candidatus Gastranaerophilaceae bacterium]|nr:TolC family protein [Candidatus Gastranaerophilaceae bacterium]HPT41932.1 TolC family protein [Candidatus Gastranaerophilaceae bacterium]